MIELCDYGCGRPAIHQFKNGKFCCNKIAANCPNQTKKKSEWFNQLNKEERDEFLKKRNSSIQKTLTTPEHKSKISNIIKNIWKDPNHIYNNKDHQKKRNKILSEAHLKPESIKLKSKILKKKWSDPNSKFNSIDSRNKSSISMINCWESKTEREKVDWINNLKEGWTEEKRNLQSIMLSKKWKTKNFRFKMKEGRRNSPNLQEQELQIILDDLFPNEYKFVGDFELFINGKNPDFISLKNKKVIEFFGAYWHGEHMTGKKETIHEEERTNHFVESGFDCIVIWDYELKEQEILINKLKTFN